MGFETNARIRHTARTKSVQPLQTDTENSKAHFSQEELKQIQSESWKNGKASHPNIFQKFNERERKCVEGKRGW